MTSARSSRREWRDRVEVVEGDASSDDVLARALDGVDVAYYLLHSMDGRPGFVERDRELATTFGDAAQAAGVGRIVYMSGPAPRRPRPQPAPRLPGRGGRDPDGSGVPTAVLQAAVIIGSGSASFEMLRHLTRRLPVMVTPKWLDNRIQPIAVRDVLHYLAAAPDLPPEVNRTFDIGGPDVLTYREMIQRFARSRRAAPAADRHRAGAHARLAEPVGRAGHAGARPASPARWSAAWCTRWSAASTTSTTWSAPPPGGALGYDAAVEPPSRATPRPAPEPGTVDPARITSPTPLGRR